MVGIMTQRQRAIQANLKARHFIESAIWHTGHVPADKSRDCSLEIISYLEGSDFCSDSVRGILQILWEKNPTFVSTLTSKQKELLRKIVED